MFHASSFKFQASGFKKNGSGFTLIELLVSIFIIIILFLMALANYRTGQQQLTLERAANKLAQDIRRAQEMAMAAEKCKGQIPKGGYGVYLRKVPEADKKSYVLFCDIGNFPNGRYDPGSENVETIFFEGGVEIKEFTGNHLNVIFIPPDPTVFFKDGNGLPLADATVAITICLSNNEARTKIITVNKAGLIDVQ